MNTASAASGALAGGVLELVQALVDFAKAFGEGTHERAHAYKWLMWLTNTLQATLIVYFYPERWMNEGNSAGVAELKSHAQARVGPGRTLHRT